MRPARTLLVACGGDRQGDSFTVRSDNLATTATYEGCRCRPMKHCTTIASPFVLTVDTDRVRVLSSSHIQSLIPRGKCVIDREITCIHSTADYIAAGAGDGRVRVWRADGELVAEQHLHIGGLSQVFIDTNMWVLFAASVTGSVGVWSLPLLSSSAEADRVWTVHAQPVKDFVVSGGYRVYSVSQDKTAKCYDFCAGCEILSVQFPTALNCCTLAHNASVLYCGGSDGQIFPVHLMQDCGVEDVFEGHTMEVCDLTLSEDDRALFSASLDGTVRRWDTATGQAINRIETGGIPFALRWMPDQVLEQAEPQHASGKRKSKRERMEMKERTKRGFPKLTPTIDMHRQQLVSAPVDDLEMLSIEDETMIAMVDVCNHQHVVPCSTAPAPVERAAPAAPTILPHQQAPGADTEDLRRQNGLLFQYVLSRQKESI